MRKRLVCCAASVMLSLVVLSQNDSLKIVLVDTMAMRDSLSPGMIDSNPQTTEIVYKIRNGIDIPVVSICAGWSLYAFTKIYSKPHSSVEKILSLDKNDINGF